MSRPDYLPSTRVETHAHVYETTRYSHRLYPADDRATVRIDGDGGEITVYGHLADLTRLRDAIVDVVAELAAARQNIAQQGTAAESAA
ncbi:hypothetical protein [Pseudonocardia xishanensis]|uniref:BON domain-containing protein n=1 Tax=Pseudonocardia xishanensis TaxID=630995 RepID=A0ABP8RPH3_9PSEU